MEKILARLPGLVQGDSVGETRMAAEFQAALATMTLQELVASGDLTSERVNRVIEQVGTELVGNDVVRQRFGLTHNVKDSQRWALMSHVISNLEYGVSRIKQPGLVGRIGRKIERILT